MIAQLTRRVFAKLVTTLTRCLGKLHQTLLSKHHGALAQSSHQKGQFYTFFFRGNVTELNAHIFLL